MKIFKIIKICLGVAASCFIFLSCEKGIPDQVRNEDTDFSNKTIVQVYVATVNASRNYIYVDGGPLTGAPLVSGSLFPSSGNGVSIKAGLRSFLIKDTAAVTTQLPLSFAENMPVATHQTIFMYDTITKPKQKTVLDKIVVPADTSCRIRFANFIYNAFDIPAVDVYSYSLAKNIFTNIPITEVTDFIPYPTRLTTDTLYIRETGTMNLLLKGSFTVLTPKRNYTLIYRGSHRGTRIATLYPTY